MILMFARGRERTGARARRRGRKARHRRLCHLLQYRGAAAVQSRRRAAPFVRVPAGDRRRSARRSRRIRPARWPNGASRSAAGATRLPSASVRPGCCSRGVTPSSARERSERRPTGSGRTWTRSSRLYADFETTDQAARVQAYRDAMAKVAAAYPDDSEASIFYALSIAAAASPADKTFADQLKAGAILETAHRRPAGSSRPRALHHPQLRRSAARRSRARSRPALREDRAVGAARAAHAVAHVYAARLLAGIDRHQHRRPARSRSATARSPKNCTRWTTGSMPTCRRRRTGARGSCSTRCRRWRRASIPTPSDRPRPGSAGVFALAAIPARYALERGAWAEAATLEPQPSKFPYTEALTYFARAIGAARIGDAADRPVRHRRAAERSSSS